MTTTDLTPALRAQDEQQIDRHGPLVAVLKSPSLETMVRRASLALFRDDVKPAELATVLGLWSQWHPEVTA